MSFKVDKNAGAGEFLINVFTSFYKNVIFPCDSYNPLTNSKIEIKCDGGLLSGKEQPKSFSKIKDEMSFYFSLNDFPNTKTLCKKFLKHCFNVLKIYRFNETVLTGFITSIKQYDKTDNLKHLKFQYDLLRHILDINSIDDFYYLICLIQFHTYKINEGFSELILFNKEYKYFKHFELTNHQFEMFNFIKENILPKFSIGNDGVNGAVRIGLKE